MGIIIIGAVVGGLLLTRLGKDEPEGQVSGEVTVGLAVVDEVEVTMLESFPLQAIATIRGNLPDGCTTLGEVDQSIEGNVLRVTVNTNRPTDEACTMALAPYQKNISLDILGLPAGDYVVDVNGAQALFTLDQDNQVDFESDKGLAS